MEDRGTDLFVTAPRPWDRHLGRYEAEASDELITIQPATIHSLLSSLQRANDKVFR